MCPETEQTKAGVLTDRDCYKANEHSIAGAVYEARNQPVGDAMLDHRRLNHVQNGHGVDCSNMTK